ncbi:MAG: DUF1761 domain-containing protein [Candidatus Gracilibacteria bacterium]
MDLALALQNAHWLQVVVATIITFALGSIWYSPILFIRPWLAGQGKTLEGVKAEMANGKKMSPAPFIISIILIFLYTLGLDIFFSGTVLVGAMGALWGALIGLLFGATALGINYAYEQKPLSFFFINAGYHVAGFAIAGLVLGLWR